MVSEVVNLLLVATSSLVSTNAPKENDGYSSEECTDNYVSQQIENVSLLDNADSGISLASFPYDKDPITDPTTHSFSDNGYDDDKPSGATRINSSYGTITGTLNTYDNATKLLHQLGDRDEDYFIFTTRNKLKYSFNLMLPTGYNFRILKYADNPKFLITATSSNLINELDAGTYYLHVYTNDSSYITSNSYTISYSSTRISNIDSFQLSENNKKDYGLVLWENEIWPDNAKRYFTQSTTVYSYYKTRRTSANIKGYVEPVLLSGTDATNKKSEEFLSYELFLWDKDSISQLYEIVDAMIASVKKVAKEKTIKKAKYELIENGVELVINILSTLSDVVSLFTTAINIKNAGRYVIQLVKFLFFDGMTFEIDLNDALHMGKFVGWLYTLRTACIWAPDVPNSIMHIPFFSYLYKDVVRNTKYIKNVKWRLISSPTPQSDDKENDGFKYDDSYISTVRPNDYTNQKYRGKLTAFKNSEDFASYVKDR